MEFYVYPKSREPEVTEMMKSIQRFYRNKAPIYDSPAVDSYVIVRNQQDQNLYRARVMAHNEKLHKFKVCLIDLGKKAIVTVDLIWEMEKRFAKLPVIVVRCTLPNALLNVTTQEIQSKIDNYIQPGRDISCTFVSASDKNNPIYDVVMDVNGLNLRQALIDDDIMAVLPNGKKLSTFFFLSKCWLDFFFWLFFGLTHRHRSIAIGWPDYISTYHRYTRFDFISHTNQWL